jgi:hypothetical protein
VPRPHVPGASLTGALTQRSVRSLLFPSWAAFSVGETVSKFPSVTSTYSNHHCTIENSTDSDAGVSVGLKGDNDSGLNVGASRNGLSVDTTPGNDESDGETFLGEAVGGLLGTVHNLTDGIRGSAQDIGNSVGSKVGNAAEGSGAGVSVGAGVGVGATA